MQEAVIIIPARMGSTRFPGKVLAAKTGKPLIQHVHDAATDTGIPVVIACDDARIEQAVTAFGGRAVMTRPDHANGTSRLDEAATTLELKPDSIVVNVQGDEPEIQPGVITSAVDALTSSGCDVATAASPWQAGDDPENPNIVKVVVRQDGRAMYFSRACIPYARHAEHPLLKHVGLYAYRRVALGRYVSLQPTPLERAESLEQLRLLEHGIDIAVAITEVAWPGIDTPEDYEAFVRRAGGR